MLSIGEFTVLFISFWHMFLVLNKSLKSRLKVNQECSLSEGCYNGSSSHLIKIGINICATLCMLYLVGIPRSSRRLFQFSYFNPSHPNKSNHPTNISENPTLSLDIVWENSAWGRWNHCTLILGAPLGYIPGWCSVEHALGTLAANVSLYGASKA